MSTEREGWVKLILRGPGGEVETPWAERVGDRRFRLDNLPWFAYGVSDDDVVEAEGTEDEGIFEFVRVAEASGNRLVRVILEDESQIDVVLEPLLDMGCHYEGANRKFIAISIPPPVSLDAVTSSLAEAGVRWEYANPTFEQLFPDDH